MTVALPLLPVPLMASRPMRPHRSVPRLALCALVVGALAGGVALLGRVPGVSGWKLMMAPNYVHEDLVGKAVALLQNPAEKELGVQLNADLTAGDQWTDMPMGKDGALTHQPADIQGFLNLLLLSPFSTDFLLKQSQAGCLMHWHCMAPKLQGRENMALSNNAVRSLILGQMSYWWDRAVATRGAPLSAGYIGHILHSLQDCHPRGHTIRDLQPLYSLSDESSLAAEDDDDRAVMKLLDMPNQKCGRILYFQGDRAQNTAGVPPLDNDRTTHGGWDKLPHSPVSTLPASVAPYEIPESLQSAKFKPEYDETESARQLQLERCSVYASYRVIRPWLRCVRAADADVQSVCSAARKSALDFISEFVLQLPGELGEVLAGGAWDRIVNTDTDLRDQFYERTTLSTSDVPDFSVGVWVPKNHSRWNVSSSEATPLGFGQEKRVELPLCNYVKGTTRDDFAAASEEAGPFTDFYNPVAMVRLANGGQPCEEDGECVSGNCGGSVLGQDYCRCGPAERNCTDSESGATGIASVSIARVVATAALQLSLLFAAGLMAFPSS